VRVIIAGGRDFTRTRALQQAISDAKAAGIEVTTLICGMASGVDMMAWHWANDKGIPIEEYPADWLGLGKKAGPIRNEQMAAKAEALIALWDGHSSGTGHMIRTMNKLGRKVYVHRVLL
jgi:predicted Rossmann fold nucleotide-binding protein DprA/Smf involved in DNA uptake